MTRRILTGHNGFIKSDLETKGQHFLLMHRLYGAIPVHRIGSGLKCDPTFRPNLPFKALRADVKVQRIEGSKAVTTWEPVYGIPRYFYSDTEIVCVLCKTQDLITALEQKKWYEVHQLPTFVQMNRCHLCRKILQTQKRLAMRVAFTAKHPTDALGWLGEAKCRMEMFKLKKTGDLSLSKAMACLRKASRLDPSLIDVKYWEGVLCERRLEPKKALAKYRDFIALIKKSDVKLRADAEKNITRLQTL